MKVLITGHGRMGQLIEKTIIANGHEVVACVDLDNVDYLNGADKTADIIIDFSNPSLVDAVVAYAKRTGTALVSGTTNITEEQLNSIKALASDVPCMWASNFSLGVNLFMHILPEITRILEGWDIELTEIHHNKKVDAPSGTAKSLVDAIDPNGEYERIYGREGNCGARTKKEIGMHALRGGTVAGEHTVAYFGNDEIFEITHKASSRQIFVDGVCVTAAKLVDKAPGYYTMEDILFA